METSPLPAILAPARRQVNAERRVTPERDAAERIIAEWFGEEFRLRNFR